MAAKDIVLGRSLGSVRKKWVHLSIQLYNQPKEYTLFLNCREPLGKQWFNCLWAYLPFIHLKDLRNSGATFIRDFYKKEILP